MQLGFLARTNRGRIALPRAYKHLGKRIDEEKESELEKLQKSEDE